MAHFYVTDRTDLIRLYTDVYAIYPILHTLADLSNKWTCSKRNEHPDHSLPKSLSKKISFIADKSNQSFIELVIKYCNEEGISVPEYENIKKKTDDYISSEVSVEDDDVLRVLKKRITNLDDLYNMTQSYATLEKWQQYCAGEKKQIQKEWGAKGADDIKTENRAQLTALFSSLGTGYIPEWKKVISFFLDKNKNNYTDNLHFLLEKLRLDHT